MSSRFSVDPMTLCQHSDYRTGCSSCFIYETGLEIFLAQGELDKCSVAIKAYEACVKEAQNKKNGHDEVLRYQKELDRVLKQHAQWKTRCEALEEVFTLADEMNKKLCEEAELVGSTRPAIFEAKAAEREDELRSLWHGVSSTKTGFESLQAEDTSRVYHFKGKDLSNIDATPDFLIDIGAGLELFLKAAGDTEVLPNKALDDQNKPAKMAYGRAIAMFGEPAGPGRDDEQNESVPLEKEMEKLDLTESMTERKWRTGDREYPYTKTELLTEPEQWQLFRSGEFLPHTALLARQYCHMVAQKNFEEDRHAEAAESANKLSVDSPSTSDRPKATSDSNASMKTALEDTIWPPPEEHDWVGFTNWIARCKKADPTFGAEFMVSWSRKRQARVQELAARLRACPTPKVSDAGFPLPTKFYRGPNIDIEDAKKLGIDLV